MTKLSLYLLCAYFICFFGWGTFLEYYGVIFTFTGHPLPPAVDGIFPEYNGEKILRSYYLTLIRYADKSGTECPVEIKWKSCHCRDVERASWWYTDAVFVWNGNCLYNFWSKYIQVPSSEYSSSDWRVIYSQYMPRGRFGKSKSISQAGAAGPCFLKLSLQNTDRDVQFFMAYKYHSRSFVSTKRHYTRHDWQDFRGCWTLQI